MRIQRSCVIQIPNNRSSPAHPRCHPPACHCINILLYMYLCRPRFSISVPLFPRGKIRWEMQAGLLVIKLVEGGFGCPGYFALKSYDGSKQVNRAHLQHVA